MRRIAEDISTMIIVPERFSRRQMDDLLGDRLNYAMIFGAESIYFQDTVHALAVDGKRFGGVNVLGVHTDWLSSDGTGIERAMVMDEAGLVKEVGFCEPVPAHIVQIVHLPLKHERRLHRELSMRFRDRGIPQVNPYEVGSERADDKAWTHNLWDRYGQEIESPRHILIRQGSSLKEVFDRLKAFSQVLRRPGLVIQPNSGTEGYKVEKFCRNAGLSLAAKHVMGEILPEDDAIVREERGNVRYKENFLNVTFRVNVAWNGLEFVAESGYAQVARDERTFPASRGRGGTIVDINEALANLYYTRDGRWIRLIPSAADIAAIKNAASDAARALNAGLDEDAYVKFMGIDIVLEVKGCGNLAPVVLEANPRPAGLSHSSEIVGISDRKPQRRVSMGIFEFFLRQASD